MTHRQLPAILLAQPAELRSRILVKTFLTNFITNAKHVGMTVLSITNQTDHNYF